MLKEIDYCISLIQLQEYSDRDLEELQGYAQKDMDEYFRATCTYYMCRLETRRRKYDDAPENMDIKCISNIFDSEHEIIFRVGRHYRMYSVDRIMLIYDDKWIPYIFTIDEEDSRCVWKYFGVWKDTLITPHYTN